MHASERHYGIRKRAGLIGTLAWSVLWLGQPFQPEQSLVALGSRSGCSAAVIIPAASVSLHCPIAPLFEDEDGPGCMP
jgi:hypothetical protein